MPLIDTPGSGPNIESEVQLGSFGGQALVLDVGLQLGFAW